MSKFDGKIDSIFINGNFATMKPGGEPYGAIENAAMAVSNGSIAWIKPMDEIGPAATESGLVVQDLEGAWVTPGLIDCHTHIVYGGNRAAEFELRLLGASYEEIARKGGGIVSTVKATREATEDELLESAAPRLAEMMAQGVTCVEIKSGYGLDLDTEIRMLKVARRLGEIKGIKVVTSFLGAHALPTEYKDRSDEYIEFVCDTVLPRAAGEGLVDAVDAFCENIAFSVEQVDRLFKKATELGLPVRLHAEQLSDQKGSRLVASYGGRCVDHIEYLAEEDIPALAEAGVVATLLPGAFYFLRETKMPPVEALRKNGVDMAVSTDSNPGSCPCTSPLLMLNMACTLFRLTPEEALSGMTRVAAKALGLSESKGMLAEGMDADFVAWNVTSPGELAYRMGANPCLMVIAGGRRIDNTV